MADTKNPQTEYFISGMKRILTSDELAILARYGYTARNNGFVDSSGKFITDFRIIETIIKTKDKRSSGKITNTFDEIMAEGVRKGKISSKKSAEWFFDLARGYRRMSQNKLLSSDKDRLRTNFEIGKLYLYAYDAKHKETLPYWDKYPLTFIVDEADGGFYGINLHYLAPKPRMQLLSVLYDLLNNEKYDDTSKLKISYGILKNAIKYKAFKPCFKRYLSSHLKSQFFEIHPREWPAAAALPLAKFDKKKPQYVYAQSDKIINK